MKSFFRRKLLPIVLVVSLFTETALVFVPNTVFAQNAVVGSGAGAGVHTGFNATGLGATLATCSGLAGKLQGLLDNLFNVAIATNVPVKDSENDVRQNCLNAVVHMLVTHIMDKITLATVNWINNGFEGSPMFLEDPGQFFGDIAKEQINDVTGWFACTGIIPPDCNIDYPFGPQVMQTILANLQKNLEANVKFSLNQVLTHGTYDQFKVDFNVGGWGGYLALLEPQNNPFGNYLLINEGLARKTAGTTVSISRNFSDQLAQSGGFLNQRSCALTGTGDPADVYIEANDPLHVPSDGTITLAIAQAVGMNSPYDVPNSVQQESINELRLRSQCKQWKTITPGNVVSNQLTTALNIPTNQLLNAKAFNEDLGLIFDALLNQLVKTGLRALDSTSNPNSVLLAQVNGQQPGQVANGNAQPPATDIIQGTGNVTLPLIQVQNQYISNAQQALPLLDELIKKIRALDYCVPGPNPRWISQATTNLQAVITATPPAPVGNTEAENETYYADMINTLTGVSVHHSSSMSSYSQFVAFMTNALTQLANAMQASYSLDQYPPTERVFLPGYFNDLDVYSAEVVDLTTYLQNIPPLLGTVSQIQSALDQIASQNGGIVDPNNPAVQAQVSIFNSISDHLATQDQLNTLISRLATYQAQIDVLDTHVANCISETITNAYPNPNKRLAYPTPFFPYAGLPGVPDATFLPGADLGSNGPNDINVEINGVTVDSPSNGLDTFQATLQSVY
jgi:hypothetical protein